MTVSLSNDFGGIGYIRFVLTDAAGDTFSRSIGVSQGLAESTSEVPNDSDLTALPSASLTDGSRNIRMTHSNHLVRFENLPERVQLSVTDLSGRHWMGGKTVITASGTATVNLQNFGSGVYIIRVRGTGVNQAFRVRR